MTMTMSMGWVRYIQATPDEDHYIKHRFIDWRGHIQVFDWDGTYFDRHGVLTTPQRMFDIGYKYNGPVRDDPVRPSVTS